jgi:hypothetical protein
VSAVQTADARLVALSQEFQENDAQFKAWDDERDNLPHNHPRVKEIEKLERAVVEHGWKIREEVFDLKAHTAEGMQAKARMVLRDLEEGGPQKPVLQPQSARRGLARAGCSESVSRGANRTASRRRADLYSRRNGKRRTANPQIQQGCHLSDGSRSGRTPWHWP